MGSEKFARLTALNRCGDISVVVDHPAQLDGYSAAMRPGDRALRVLIDVDVGQRRTGVTEVEDAVRLSETIASALEFAITGIQGFAGNAQHIIDPDVRRAAAAAAAEKLRRIADALAQNGRPAEIVTGSGTGTYLQDAGGPYTELQAGSYLFMDADYASVVDEREAGPAFEPSLFVLATVVSVNRPGEVTVDAGTKALATNGPAPCVLRGVGAGATYRFAGDEHGIINIPPGQPAPALGSRV